MKSRMSPFNIKRNHLLMMSTKLRYYKYTNRRKNNESSNISKNNNIYFENKSQIIEKNKIF